MAFPTTSIIDDYNRANADPVSGNWSGPAYGSGPSANRCKIVSNQLCPTSTTPTSGRSDDYSTTSYGPDVEAYVTIAAVGEANTATELVVRMQNAGTDNVSGYGAYALRYSTGESDLTLFHLDNAAGTVFPGVSAYIPYFGNGTISWQIGDKYGIAVIGSTLQLWINQAATPGWNLVGSLSDNSYTTAGPISPMIEHSAWKLDDVGGGTIGGARMGVASFVSGVGW